MRRGTTVRKVFTLTGNIDFSSIRRAVVTIKQGNVRLHQKISFDADGKGEATFPREQTLHLRLGECQEQAAMLMEDGTVVATDIVRDVVSGDILYEGDL